MPKFSFLSWNVRHFKGTKAARLDDVDALITNLDPDIFGLIEFQGKNRIREFMVERFPEYDFAVTDSTGNLEVVLGTKRGKFDQVIWTQKREFNNKERRLRPGALASVSIGGEFYSLLFLHTDSGTTVADYGNRQIVFKKIWKLRKALAARSPQGRSNLIVLGDLNTMGCKSKLLSGDDEINRLTADAQLNGMVLLDKDRDATWSQWGAGPRGARRKLKVSELAGLMTSNLDHVIADATLDFVAHGDSGEPIHVEGWQQLDGSQKATFLWDLSDHCSLFGEVW